MAFLYNASMKKISFSFLLLFSLLLFGCSNITSTDTALLPKKPIRNIKIISDSISFIVEDTINLSIKAEDDSSLNKITWSFDSNYLEELSKTDSSITLKALKSGTITITASETDTKRETSLKIEIKDKEQTLPVPQQFNPYDKQPIGFDVNPLYSKEHLLNIIKNYGYYGGILRDNPQPNTDFDFTNERIIFSPAENTIQTISLIDTTTKKAVSNSDIQWFVIQNYPSDAIYNLEESDNAYCPITIVQGSDNSTVTLHTKKTPYYNNAEYQTNGDIVAVVDNKYIHRQPFYVLNTKEEKQRDAVTDINKVVYDMISPMWQFTDLEKALFLQETVCKHLTYDLTMTVTPTENNIFLERSAVCEGYAKMYGRLAKELGMLVRVDMDPVISHHAWNRIWIDDGFYYLDTTWDDIKEDPDKYLLYYFLMPVVNFEESHPRTESAKKDGHFGEKHISLGENEALYNSMKEKGMPKSDPTKASTKPDLTKIDFIGTSYNSGYITTNDTNLQYSTGYDGIWHPIIPGVKNKVENITLVNRSYYVPKNHLPFFILIRRMEPEKESSEYVKINITDKLSGPTWIEVAEDGTIYNLNTNMEYTTDNIQFKDVKTNTLKLPSGTYYFRLKGSKNNFPSESYKVIVK